jgi:MoxR-like ATPase
MAHRPPGRSARAVARAASVEGSRLRSSAEVIVPRFVGRDDELRRAADALGRFPALVLVEGEAGIGKSRLVREALAVAGAAARAG